MLADKIGGTAQIAMAVKPPFGYDFALLPNVPLGRKNKGSLLSTIAAKPPVPIAISGCEEIPAALAYWLAIILTDQLQVGSAALFMQLPELWSAANNLVDSLPAGVEHLADFLQGGAVYEHLFDLSSIFVH